MGFNTTILILNDSLHRIREDKDFGKNLVNAIGRQFMENKPLSDFDRHQTTVMGQHHADVVSVLMVGGNMGVEIAQIYNGGHVAEIEDQINLLKEVADKFGFNLVRKPQKVKKLNKEVTTIRDLLGIDPRLTETKKKDLNLPEPECCHGYPKAQLEKIFKDKKKLTKFFKWMSGQTVCGCQKEEYNHEKNCHQPSRCMIKYGVTHEGTIYFRTDVERFIRGLPVID